MVLLTFHDCSRQLTEVDSSIKEVLYYKTLKVEHFYYQIIPEKLCYWPEKLEEMPVLQNMRISNAS